MKKILKSMHISKSLTATFTALLTLSHASVWAQETPQAVTDYITKSIVGEKPASEPNNTFTVMVIQDPSEYEYSSQLGSEELNKFQVSSSITPDTTELLGEQIDLNTGTISFHHTDVSIPGNNALEMSVSRVFRGKQWHFGIGGDYAFEDWQLDIPYIHTSLAFTLAGYSGSWGQGQPCTGDLEPEIVSSSGINYSSDMYWTGDTLHVPGKTHDKLLNTDGTIATGQYGKVTKSNWRISCADRFENDEKVSEAFIAHSPDGLIYTFSELKLISTKPVDDLDRYQAYMLVSKVADRFGNEVNYNYTEGNLTSITSTDGRLITLQYTDVNKPYRVTSVTTNNRTWTYSYTDTALQSVTRPDNTAWSFDMGLLGQREPGTPTSTCGAGNTSSFTVSLTHPNGITGTFEVADVIHGRTNVPHQLNLILGKKDMSQCYYTLAVKKKTLTGPGLPGAGQPNLEWNYEYSSKDGTWDSETDTQPNVDLTYTSGVTPNIPGSSDITDSKTTTVIAPDGSKTVYFYNRDYSSFNEGQLEAIDQFDSNGTTLLERTEYSYEQGPRIGLPKITDDNVAPLSYQILKNQTKITRYQSDGIDTYTTNFSLFNTFGVAQKQSESNTVNSETRYTSYSFDDAKIDFMNESSAGFWLLNQPLTTSISTTDSNYTVVNETTYHSATGGYKFLPYESKQNGVWQSRNSEYHLTGNIKGLLKKVEYNVQMNDGNNRYQLLDSYNRGQVSQLTLPGKTVATSTVSATKTIDNNGWVTHTVDLNGNGITYGYDDLGRLTLIDPDDSTIANTTITYTKVDAADTSLSGVVTDMYKQTITQGNHEIVNFLDALNRTVLTKERDKTDSATTRYTRQNMNAYNHVTFKSFPSTSSSITYGHAFTFDGMQRQISQTDTVTSASVVTTFKQGNKIAVNDFNGNTTTTTYQAYGSPTQKLATHIASPEGIATSLSYNLFNNITAITQGSGEPETRFYDSYHRLCKTVRPDVGDVVYERDVIGQVKWQATGTSSSTSSCDIANVNVSEKTQITYNNWGLVSTTDYTDNTLDIHYSYDNNGNLASISNSATAWSYQYNSQNQLKQESLNVAGKSLTVGYTFNSLGHVSSMTYPTSRVVNFSPNALGQSTQASNFATSATYHQNGMLESYSASNGTTFSQTQTLNQLPDVLSVSKGAAVLQSLDYNYDNNYNITSITDSVNANQSISNTYDDADRLKTSSGSWGNGTFNYNARGDITSKTLGTNSYTYSYSNGSLTSVSGATTRSFTYNSKGEVTNNGIHSFTRNKAGQITAAAGHAFVYDGHSRRVIDEKGGKKTISFYSQAGVLLYQYDEASQTHSDYIYLAGKQIAKADFAIVGGSNLIEKVGYTGHQFDQDLGLNYMQARYYDPVIGRFYSNDPIGFRDIHSFNRYAYANNNPYKYIDPFGMAPKAKGFTCRGDLDCPSGGHGVRESRLAKIQSWFGKYKTELKAYKAGKKILKVDAALEQISEALSLWNNYNEIMGSIPLMNKQELLAFDPSSRAYSTFDINAMRQGVQYFYSAKNRTRIQAQTGELLLKGTVGIGGVALSIPFKSVGYISFALEIANFDYSFTNKN